MEMPNYNLESSSEFEMARLDILQCVDHGQIDAALNILDALSPSSKLQLLEKRVREELLRNDAYDAYSQMFDVKALISWVYQNAQHVVNHCPNVLEAFGVTHQFTAAQLITENIKDPVVLRNALYTPSNFVNASVPTCLRCCMDDPHDAQSFWQNVNPFWCGAPNSLERQWAVEHYFDVQYWPNMVFNALFQTGPVDHIEYHPSTWLSWGPMPYTTALIHHLQRQEYRFLPLKTINILVTADPWDACVAQAIIEYLPGANVELSFSNVEFHNDTLLLDKAKYLVSIYAGLEAWENLKQGALNKTLDLLQHTHTLESFEFAFQHQPT